MDKYIQDNFDRLVQAYNDKFKFDFYTIEAAKLISGERIFIFFKN
jgi:hypothetical protein